MAPSGGTESCYQLVNEGSVTSQKPVSAWLPHPGNWKLETSLVAGRGIPSAGVIQGEVALQAALALPSNLGKVRTQGNQATPEAMGLVLLCRPRGRGDRGRGNSNLAGP